MGTRRASGGDKRRAASDIRRMTILRRAFFALSFLLCAGPAFAADKLVVAFGDSLMAGYRLGPTEGFAPQLEAALRRSGIAARVHGAGVSGDTTAQGKARLNWVLTSLKAKPDLVIVELGANDMLRGLSPKQAESNLDAILAELRRRGINTMLAGMIAMPNLGPDYARAFNPIYGRLARKYGVSLYPFFLRGMVGDRRYSIGDGIHPNKAGVGVIVRGILPPVRRALTR